MTITTITFATCQELADWLNGQSFYEWQATAGYDTRPYYRTSNGRRALPVAHRVECVDREAVEYGSDRVALLATIKTLHTLGVPIVVPDYSGCNHCGNTTWTPSDYGAWASSYEDFRD